MSAMSHGEVCDVFGAYVRSQRQLAHLTLRQAAALASISNPYLSQIERGLALPSIAVITSLADALSVSAETLLYLAAGLSSATPAHQTPHTEDAIRQDSRLDEGQKRALLAVLASFVGAPSVAPDKPVRARTRKKAAPVDQQPLEPPTLDREGPDHA